MKLKLPAPANVRSPNGETIQVSAAQVIEHVVRTGRSLGMSGDVERVRIGSRILAALTTGTAERTGEITPEDVEALKVELAKPSRGWVSVPVDVVIQTAPGQPEKTARRHFVPNAIDLLPIVDGLLGA